MSILPVHTPTVAMLFVMLSLVMGDLVNMKTLILLITSEETLLKSEIQYFILPTLVVKSIGYNQAKQITTLILIFIDEWNY